MISSAANNNISNKTAFGANWVYLKELETALPPKQEILRLNTLATAVKEGDYKYAGRKKLPNNFLNYPALHTFVSKDGDMVCINSGKRNNGMLLPEIAMQDSDGQKTMRFLGSTLDSENQKKAIKKTIKAFEAIIPKRKPKKAKTLAVPAMTQPMVQRDKYLQLA